MNRSPIVAVDFDGTICEEVTYPGIGKIIPGAVSTLKELSKQGAILILWTCRSGKPLSDAIMFCLENGIRFQAVNKNWSQLPFETSSKIFADIYIDNRSRDIDWGIIRNDVLNLYCRPFTILN